MGKFLSDTDRRTRAAASKAYYKWFAENLSELDEIYDKMVHYATPWLKTWLQELCRTRLFKARTR